MVGFVGFVILYTCVCNFDNYPGILSKMPIHCEIHFVLSLSSQYMSYSLLYFFTDTFHAVSVHSTWDTPALIAAPPIQA